MAQSVFRYAGDKGDNAADALAGSSVDALRNLGLSQTKAGALVAIAQKYVEGSFTAPALEALDDAAVRARLTGVKGVGPWTADMVLIFGLNRPDVWAQTDFGLRKALEKPGSVPRTRSCGLRGAQPPHGFCGRASPQPLYSIS